MYAKYLGGVGSQGNDSMLALQTVHCNQGDAIIGFAASPGCFGVAELQVNISLALS
jgi:hypothetical protein